MDTAQTPTTQWFSYEELAEALGVSTRTIQRRVKDRTIAPQLRHGHRGHWFTTEDLDTLKVLATAEA